MSKCELFKKQHVTVWMTRLAGIATIFFLLQFIGVSAQAYPPPERLSIKMENVKLSKIFEVIEEKTDYQFLYNVEDVQKAPGINISVSNATVLQILEMCFKDYPLDYHIRNKTVLVLAKNLVQKTEEAQALLFKLPPLQIRGKVTNQARQPLEAVSVTIKGTGRGTATNSNGDYTISAPDDAILIFTFVGYQTEEVEVNGRSQINIILREESKGLDEVVVTALGISREKKSLGYASQQISGGDVSTVRTDNITDALSGKVAGLQIKKSGNMGGSTNAIIRGNNSLTGDNQALWVVDGVPINNSNFNTEDQIRGSSGFDFGNMASDINPDDVESINVLKGAAATALYGSRAANGAIIITTKKGSEGKKIDISLSSSVLYGTIDKSTFPTFQTVYGRGYGKFNGLSGDDFFDEYDFDSDGSIDLVAPFAQYASYGAPFDPNLMVFNWASYYPSSPNYMRKTPWAAPKHGPLYFFENPLTFDNNLSFGGSVKDANYRISYSNYEQNGLFPNSNLKRSNVSMNGAYQLTNKLTISGSSNFVRTSAIGRNQTGTDFRGNAIALFRHYYTTDIDIQELKNMYFVDKLNTTHTPGRSFDNIYFNRYENYNTDKRNRFFGNVSLGYDIFKGIKLEGRIGIDTYNFIEEDRRSNKSGGVSRYSRRNINFEEINYDLMLTFNRNLSSSINLNGVIGTNIRRSYFESILATTNGGIIIDRLYSLSNSVNQPQSPKEILEKSGVDGLYGMFSFGYKNKVYLDITGRRDHSSTLPVGNSVYYYPSVASSIIFSEFIKSNVLNFGKFRLNYAMVGNSAPVGILQDVLIKPSLFGNILNYETNPTKRNENLKPESTSSLEAGIEAYFLNRRIGFDISIYKTNTKDQIMPVAVTPATGYISKFVNSGEIENKGIELSLKGVPIKNKDFSWNIVVNWARNKNTVVSLFESVTNLQIGSVAEGVTINATVGEPFGMIRGSDFVYKDGKRVINQTDGSFMKTTGSNNNLGVVFPDWTGGISNQFSFKEFSFSFLIDAQKGGNIFSIDNLYGYESGAYNIFIGNNELGNPIRNFVADGGGILLDGVTPDGSKNQVRTEMNSNAHAYGSRKAPNALHIYDASYVKLREVALTYSLPKSFLKKSILSEVLVSITGSNVWIINKNIPFSDPESGFSSGNLQGVQAGIPPSIREFGFNLKLHF